MKLKKPPTKPYETGEASQFISEAETYPQEKQYPWEGLSDENTKVFSLRLSEVMYEKLRFVAKNSKRKSMNDVCLDALDTELEFRINNIMDGY